MNKQPGTEHYCYRTCSSGQTDGWLSKRKAMVMGKQFSSVVFIFFALFIVLCSGCRESVGTVKTRNHFHHELSEGRVRVVLLRACPVPSPTNHSTFVVTYGVEVPTNGAFSDLRFSISDEVDLVVRGKPIDWQVGVTSASMGFDDLPRRIELREPTLQDDKAMICEDVTFDGLHIGAQQVDIRIRFSWRGSPLSFDFQNVQVPYRNLDDGA